MCQSANRPRDKSGEGSSYSPRQQASGSCCSTMPQKRLPVGNASSSRLVTLNFLKTGYNAGVSGEIKEQVRHTRKGL